MNHLRCMINSVAWVAWLYFVGKACTVHFVQYKPCAHAYAEFADKDMVLACTSLRCLYNFFALIFLDSFPYSFITDGIVLT